MFRGQFHHAIDAKGRISLPSRFRELLVADAERFILTPDPFDPCLQLFPLAAWENLERRIAELPSLDATVVRFRRVYVSAAIECELDKAGRVLVPPHLRERGGLERECVFAGMGPRIDLWSTERWNAATAMTPEQLADFRQALAEVGL